MVPLRFITGGILLLSALSHAAILGVPGQFPGIQAALDATASGDTVLVERGTYTEHLVGPGHGFTLMSHYPMTGDSADWLETILDGTQSGTCLIIPSTDLEWVSLQGQRVCRLLEGNLRVGSYPDTVNGAGLASGVYFAVANGPRDHQVQKLLLVK